MSQAIPSIHEVLMRFEERARDQRAMPRYELHSWLYHLRNALLYGSQWMRPSERLPADGDLVIVFTETGRQESAVYDEPTRDFCFAVGFAHCCQVKWWMPMPEAPRDEHDTIPAPADTEVMLERPEG